MLESIRYRVQHQACKIDHSGTWFSRIWSVDTSRHARRTHRPSHELLSISWDRARFSESIPIASILLSIWVSFGHRFTRLIISNSTRVFPRSIFLRLSLIVSFSEISFVSIDDPFIPSILDTMNAHKHDMRTQPARETHNRNAIRRPN